MTDERRIAVPSYEAMIAILCARKISMRLADASVDDIAGIAAGQTSKILRRIKKLGAKTLFCFPQALGYRVELVEDEAAMRAIAEYALIRQETNVRNEGMPSALRTAQARRLQELFSDPWHFKKLGRKGGQARAKKLPRWMRSAAARRASTARWVRYRKTKRKDKAATKTADPVA